MQRDDNKSRTTEFWGICCEGNKKYSQVVKQKFHITMAALDPTAVPTSPVVSLMVDRGGCEYLLCSLKPSTALQVNLNLYFDKGEKVTFSLRGQGKVHLSGYHIYDKEVVVKEAVNSIAKSEKNKTKGSSVNFQISDDSSANKGKIKKKAAQASPKKDTPTSKKTKKESDDDDDDEDDDDIFDELDEDSENEDQRKDAEKLKSYKRLYSSLMDEEEDDDDDDDDDEEEEDDDDSEESDSDEEDNKKKPSKNKVIQEKKKLKFDMSNLKSEKGKENKSATKKILNSTDDTLNSSVGRTPMPQKKTPMKLDQTSALSPKKVIFSDSEDDLDSDNEESKASAVVSPSKKQPSEPNSVPTPEKKKKKKKKKKSMDGLNTSNTSDGSANKEETSNLSTAAYGKKLPGGLEYEDIRIGNGPIAKNGRLVHVYYTGMLKDNKVFDSRKPGSKPFSFKLGSGSVIKGWDMAIEGMKVGGKRRMKIPPQLGYEGKRMGPIPPNSVLYFTVELRSVA